MSQSGVLVPGPDAAVERVALNLSWLLRLRRAGVVGQLATILIVRFGLEVHLELLPLLSVVAAGLLLNVGVQVWFLDAARRDDREHWLRQGSAVLLGSLIADIVFLTALLFASGGIGNPFWIFYFVNLVLSTVVLWGWRLIAVYSVATTCFGLLLFVALPLDGIGGPVRHWSEDVIPRPQELSLYAKGCFVAFVAVATFTAYFVRTLNAELARREAELAAERQRLSDAARLESLARLAAGAAHELSSPLSTIAVVARELERALERAEEMNLRDDARLVQSEVVRCRKILDQMSLDAGEDAGEELTDIPVEELIDGALDKLHENGRVRLERSDDVLGCAVRAPRTALTRAVRGLVRNALDASEDGQVVAVTVERRGFLIAFVVIDAGAGMDEATLKRALEPFFTTKETGAGMGLGLFLVRTLADRLGGSLALDSEVGRGTVATLSVPISALPTRSDATGLFAKARQVVEGRGDGGPRGL
ncbi:MAG: sensor histidine kinase [Planctomycetota bacterium]